MAPDTTATNADSDPIARTARRRRNLRLGLIAACASLFMYSAFIYRVGAFGIDLPDVGGMALPSDIKTRPGPAEATPADR